MGNFFKVITPPKSEPITLTDAKAWLRVDFTADDQLIAFLMTRARAYAETVTHRALATQTLQHVATIERPAGGVLSGPITEGPNWYQFNEQLGANPFGPAQFYFELAMPPIQAAQPLTIETKVTAFDAWVTFTGTTYLDDNREPARLYVMSPVTANFWRFSYTAGYDPTAYSIPPDLKHCLLEMVAFWYDHREAEDLPDALMQKLLAKRVDWM